ncbi:putative transcription factor WhiB [Streptomyces sp. Tu6071]|uniref:WhiB family transcriptional regulator n=1 Tax=Streptomyces sp. Tu6071 TaxID=355249 RepID=UPI00020E600C|nr:WhiB family transcriptional regulator [Streptomyces sp. Tu6071]EGJ77725.1 putative transcription factor WhiB [Streptomyces sp. Tu6071]
MTTVQPWYDRAACLGVDTEYFYPSRSGEAEKAALALCRICPVRAECLADEEATDSPYGLWGIRGGLTAAERTKLRGPRRKRRAAEAAE